MTFGFTRDSATWTLTIIGAMLGYLLTAGEPSTWGYEDYLRHAAFLVAVLAGKVSTSPLPHSVEGGVKVTKSGK